MFQVGGYVFKRAETADELQQIHSLNYRTFVSEIPQHDDPGGGRLVDKFHDKNVYFIAAREGRVVGMVSVHDRPPFSVASRLSDPTILDQPGRRPLEVRLLAIDPERRNSTVFGGLVWMLWRYSLAHGYTDLYISGLEERLPLYRHIGFAPLGPAVPCGGSRFVPMAVPVDQLEARNPRFVELWRRRCAGQETADAPPAGPSAGEVNHALPPAGEEVCLLPGPVTIAPEVRRAFEQPPVYHRGAEFIDRFDRLRRRLGELVGGREVALLNGSGTLANEVVAATLAAEPRPARGLVLVNGEFGRRLARQAARFGLACQVLSWPWGQPWNLDEVAAALQTLPPDSWVWGVHLESSTGVLNDLPGLVRLATAVGARVCADCVSSLGAVPLDLRKVYLASGASGKSLGSYAGVAMIFADPAALGHLDTGRTPTYLDLRAALAHPGPLYTFPSCPLFALEAAVAAYATPEAAAARYAAYAALGAYVRQQLRAAGLEPLAAEADACPVVTTFSPPGEESSAEFVARCRGWGFAVGGLSSYLAEQRLVQIATMGSIQRRALTPLFEQLLRRLVRPAGEPESRAAADPGVPAPCQPLS